VLKGVTRSDSGASATEFAILAPAFLALVVGLIEVTGLFLANGLLEGAVREASRYGITVRCNENRTTVIRQIVADNTYGLIDMNTVTISTSVYQNFASIGQPEPFTDSNSNGRYDAGEPFTDINGNGAWDADQGRTGEGTAGDVVQYTIRYNWPLFSPFLAPVLGSGGIVPLRATVAVRNEPPGSCV
jgi:Flp pilus assembly protein TadG